MVVEIITTATVLPLQLSSVMFVTSPQMILAIMVRGLKAGEFDKVFPVLSMCSRLKKHDERATTGAPFASPNRD